MRLMNSTIKLGNMKIWSSDYYCYRMDHVEKYLKRVSYVDPRNLNTYCNNQDSMTLRLTLQAL